MRLDKFICKSTPLNPQQANERIASGVVCVNGQVMLKPSTQVHENNVIELDGQPLKARPFRYLMLHKPADTVCSNIDEAYPSLFNALEIQNSSELHVAGRLDADTTGLVLATDDGRWSFDIIRPNQDCSKLYRVGLRDSVSGDTAERFKSGLLLQGETSRTLPAELEILSPTDVRLTLTEGRYHQVKRMFAAVGNRVVSLHREQIGPVELDVAVGCWRELTPLEVAYWK
ncbi:MAG: 16S rRNA pseudouridine516 synthase [Pseudoalteromonas tetraodonis]|jgi:16S rRNA pseudouridine516 synthase